MMLGGHNVEADVISDKIFVQRLMIEVGGDFRIAVSVGQGCAHGISSIEHLLCDKGISYLATVKGSHGQLASDRHGMASLAAHELDYVGHKLFGLLDFGLVARIFDQREAGIGD